MAEDIHLFTDDEGEFLTGQALAEAIKQHGIARFNALRAARPAWKPDMRAADLTVSDSEQPRRGLEGKMLGDPAQWQPPTEHTWAQEARFADFSSADLSGANLSALEMSGADLHGARLANANLGETQLRRTDLRDADLSNATLQQVDLFEADLTGATLDGADLSGANLFNAAVTVEALAEAILDESTLLPDGASIASPDSTWTQRLSEARVASGQAASGEAPSSVVAKIARQIRSLLGR